MTGFQILDLLIIGFYLLLVSVIGFLVSRQREESSTDYFLAGKSMGWFAVGLTLFATNISSEHFIGLAGSGAARGLAVGSFEWMAVFFLILLGWVFAPLFLRANVFTVPEFIGKRFNRASRLYLSGISIFTYLFTKTSVTLFAGGLLIRGILGWDMRTSTIAVVVLTGIYAIVGGLRAVMYTAVVQAFFLIAGAVLLTVFGLQEVGGFAGLQAHLPADYFCLWKPASDPDFPWTGILFGAPILGVWYWCTDQYIVQRVLSAKNLLHARRGTIFAGFLKILPVFILVLPGLIAAALFPGIQGDEAYARLLSGTLLPVGLKGLVVAGLLAALMSSLAASFNSAATIFTMDIYRTLRPDTSEQKLVLVGRLATTAMVIAAILWIPLTRFITTHIYLYLQSMQAYISPPITAVFVIGIFWKRINGRGAIWALVVGGLIGAARLVLEIISNLGGNVPATLHWFVELNFLHFAIFLFVVSAAVLVLASLPAKKFTDTRLRDPLDESLDWQANRMFGSALFRLVSTDRANLVLSALLLMFVLGLWGAFL